MRCHVTGEKPIQTRRAIASVPPGRLVAEPSPDLVALTGRFLEANPILLERDGRRLITSVSADTSTLKIALGDAKDLVQLAEMFPLFTGGAPDFSGTEGLRLADPRKSHDRQDPVLIRLGSTATIQLSGVSDRVLRREVQQRMNAHPSVTSFVLGEQRENWMPHEEEEVPHRFEARLRAHAFALTHVRAFDLLNPLQIRTWSGKGGLHAELEVIEPSTVDSSQFREVLEGFCGVKVSGGVGTDLQVDVGEGAVITIRFESARHLHLAGRRLLSRD